MHWAAAANDGEAARRLLELGAAPDITDNGDGSDFNEQGMRRLKLLGKKVDGWKNACATPLLVAAVFNSAAAASILIANDAEVDAKDEDGWTPLHWAAHNNAPEIAKMLNCLRGGRGFNSRPTQKYVDYPNFREFLAFYNAFPR